MGQNYVLQSGIGSGWYGYTKPDASNTGPTDEGALVASNTIEVTQGDQGDGYVLENVDISGILRIKANNVTVRNFRVTAGSVTSYAIQCNYGYTGTVIEDGECDGGSSASILGSNFTAHRLNLHETGGDGVKPQSNSLIESCWIHHLGTKAGSHADCFQVTSGTNITIRANFCDISRITLVPPYKSNACVLAANESGDTSFVSVEYNWLNGGSNVVYFNDKENGNAVENMSLLYNRFYVSPAFSVGPFIDKSTDAGATVIGNVWHETDELMSINQ